MDGSVGWQQPVLSIPIGIETLLTESGKEIINLNDIKSKNLTISKRKLKTNIKINSDKKKKETVTAAWKQKIAPLLTHWYFVFEHISVLISNVIYFTLTLFSFLPLKYIFQFKKQKSIQKIRSFMLVIGFESEKEKKNLLSKIFFYIILSFILAFDVFILYFILSKSHITALIYKIYVW